MCYIVFNLDGLGVLTAKLHNYLHLVFPQKVLGQLWPPKKIINFHPWEVVFYKNNDLRLKGASFSPCNKNTIGQSSLKFWYMNQHSINYKKLPYPHMGLF